MSYHSRYYLANREKIKAYSRTNTLKMKWQIFELLGHECAKCGMNDKRVLQIDHINGDGYKERKLFKSGYRGQCLSHKLAAIKSNRSRFQILCANCHCIKTHEAKEHLKHRNVLQEVQASLF